MSLMSFFSRRTTAPVARDRLQILLAHERGIVGGKSDLVALLREEILNVIGKHVSVEREKVQIKLDRGDSISTLEIEVEIPSPASPRIAVNA
ncbi:cell division topological specificity factor MinE [Microvirga pudoricolor]|uniref:cell division topological specificity factor MinE n=1 Tax=Microvirga pudoricolor TaxID=2778729 RepID=UPI0019523C66|nr:cell division topological specificity factor MinE [Microvirga pudoricolor]MBM6594856.1 cell division topological specificity factor MinE [Microvirga pudoricolor]